MSNKNDLKVSKNLTWAEVLTKTGLTQSQLVNLIPEKAKVDIKLTHFKNRINSLKEQEVKLLNEISRLQKRYNLEAIKERLEHNQILIDGARLDALEKFSFGPGGPTIQQLRVEKEYLSLCRELGYEPERLRPNNESSLENGAAEA